VLGLPPPDGGEWTAAGWDLAAILDAWCDELRRAGFELAVEPTPSRGRTLRNLTVNTFHPVELLSTAWSTRGFDWDPDLDEQRERGLTDGRLLVAYAERVTARWHDFLLEAGDAPGDPAISTPRGELAFSELVASQRWHAAYHHRQLVEFLRSRGVSARGPIHLAADLGLPDEVF
jgi:hypothetical protein